jgi:hypothetical protein
MNALEIGSEWTSGNTLYPTCSRVIAVQSWAQLDAHARKHVLAAQQWATAAGMADKHFVLSRPRNAVRSVSVLESSAFEATHTRIGERTSK